MILGSQAILLELRRILLQKRANTATYKQLITLHWRLKLTSGAANLLVVSSVMGFQLPLGQCGPVGRIKQAG